MYHNSTWPGPPVFVNKTHEMNKEQQQFVPVGDIIDTYCSRYAFYQYVKAGRFSIYKLGKLSFVKSDEFFAAFKPASDGGGKQGGVSC